MLKLWQLELFQTVTNTIKILLWQFCYAVDNGAKVINGSFGKDFHSQRMSQEAIKYAESKDVLMFSQLEMMLKM
jgi:hypothetical protein